ncbi:hypothetical protein ABT063_27100 [Streptomyces sp. NPDC002838]|uniref:hypothetical protein n=1 Tax=Streptomyces sp. NPDC002838 TaxID=3154436 RepID=UPI00332BDEF7
MHYGESGLGDGDGEQGEFTESEPRRFWPMGGQAKSQRELEALCHQLRTEIAGDVRSQIQFLTTRTDRKADDVLREVHALGEQLGAVARNVQLIVDALRDQGVRDAFDGGSATSDIHHRHLDLAKNYSRLVRQDLRQLVRPLCPQQGDEGAMELARRRAHVVSQLVVTLFQPLDQPLSTEREQIVAELRASGLATDVAQFRGQFDAVFRKAAELRDGVADLPITAHLDFAVDLTALPADHYQAWNGEQADGTRPEFLIAPAYVMEGDRPRNFTKPIVFVAPAVGS